MFGRLGELNFEDDMWRLRSVFRQPNAASKVDRTLNDSQMKALCKASAQRCDLCNLPRCRESVEHLALWRKCMEKV